MESENYYDWLENGAEMSHNSLQNLHQNSQNVYNIEHEMAGEQMHLLVETVTINVNSETSR